MIGETQVVVRIGLEDLATLIRERNKIDLPLHEVRVEADTLILTFAALPTGKTVAPPMSLGTPTATNPLSKKRVAKKRHRGKRRRMKTRGWKVVARIVNSHGQKAAIYEPFVRVLSAPGLSKAQQRAAVAQVLRSNHNDPSEASVQYFLENTLEYLRQEPPTMVTTADGGMRK